MRININLIFLLGILPFLAQCQNKSEISYHENGKIKSVIKKVSGTTFSLKEYDSMGNIQLIADLKNGKQDGKTTFFYSNGQPKRVVFFKDGIQQDSMILYHDNGTVRERSFIKDGRKSGAIRMYRMDGSLRLSGRMVNDRLNGECIYYKKDGQIVDTVRYDNGNILGWNLFNKQNLSFVVAYPNNWMIADKKSALLVLFDTKSNASYKATANLIEATSNNDLPLNEVLSLWLNEAKSISESSFKLLNRTENRLDYIVEGGGEIYRVITKIQKCSSQYYAFTIMVTNEKYEEVEHITELMIKLFNCK